jgi:hypothetical protein
VSGCPLLAKRDSLTYSLWNDDGGGGGGGVGTLDRLLAS